MTTLTLRPMTVEEFEAWQQALAIDYAAEKVAAGVWDEEGSVQKARDEASVLLPEGLATDLNVFGRNDIAFALYESAGYVTTSRQMRKEWG
jgi:hypothetical protein